MNIFIYSDESGVFDKAHNQIFVFGGILFLSRQDRDICVRKYKAAEDVLRKNKGIDHTEEIKASVISNSDKGKLYRSLNQIEKFGVVIRQETVMDQIFKSKKSKQRYLDWAYKIAVRKKLEHMIFTKQIDPSTVEGIYFFVDEHTTATDGVYELKESIEQEFKYGTFSNGYTRFHAPIFPEVKTVSVDFCNSKKNTLVRAADIVANQLYYKYLSGQEICKENFKIEVLHKK